ncbi:hypothetical protein Fmac_021052 [Flemingia macrophylla]|uniref:Nuclear pore complex protein NUP214 n=1 Tax=Flemingia macrophylla TaxID=520843 RepID=A0ABD1LVT7_9FABA
MSPAKIEPEEVEGEVVGTTDYFFVKIGEAVPLKASDSNFDVGTLPSQPLAVSERFRLTFVAHSSGFFVARTKDLIDSANKFKDEGSGTPVQQLSFVDVSIGRVRALAVSTDNLTLAASVSGDIRFYSVENFIKKEVKQSFSSSLDDSTFVKDMRWITTTKNSYVILSNVEKLYYGEIGLPLKHVMDNVDAVDWGLKGSFVAVASKSVLSILSANFEERVSISLSFGSWIGDDASNSSIKVDAVKCVRSDSIVIGCIQLTDDGKEENYLIQVIRSQFGEINDGCSELVVQSFYDIYQGLIDDIVPLGSGPYLLLTYLKQCQLAINANIKNTDQHIMLLGWSADDDKSEAAVIDIERDNWVPRIELQENGDDNLLLGLCIDNVSIYQKVGVQLGVEEKTELSPYCVLICLTLEGKLVMFHVACLAGSKASPEVDSVLYNDEEASVNLPEDGCTSSQGLQKQEMDKTFEVSGNLMAKSSGNPQQITQTNTKYTEVESVANSLSLKSNVQEVVSDVNEDQDTDNQNPCHPGEQQKCLGPKTTALGTSIGSSPGFSSYNNLQATTEKSRELWTAHISSDSQRASSSLPSEIFLFPKKSDVSSISASSNADDVGFQSKKYTTSASNVPGSLGGKPILSQDVYGISPSINSPSRPVQSGSFGGKPVLSQDVYGISPSINSTSRPVQSWGQQTSFVAGNMQPVLNSSSHLSSDGNTTTGKSSARKFLASNEQHGTSSKHGISSSDLSKQFGKINEMTKELDLLLRSIEESGGFRDACTTSLQSSIEAAEQGMGALSKKCKILTCQVDEHHEEVHYLLNKTIRVMAKKIYMEGIYKQASDSRYWDLWNRQKLNSELELKRQHILSLNQDLTNQLIELERHFNALELNKFSQYGGRCLGRGVFQNKFGPSRHVQSMHSLHNAISSQLVAAENLSECLSKQMSALSLRSQTEERKNVKELFETIGIPYDAAFGSPDMKGFMKTPPSKKILFSDLTCNKNQSRRNHTSVMKSCEPESARRRRDSLDQSWTCFEPPKTIIKRMLLQELQKLNRNESLISTNKEEKVSTLQESAPCQIDDRISSIVLPASRMKGSILDSHHEHEEVAQHSKALICIRVPTQVSESKSGIFQKNNSLVIPAKPAFHLTPTVVHDHSTETKDAEKSTVQKFDLISNSENKPTLHWKMPQQSSVSTYSTTETHSMLIKSVEMPITTSKMTMATSSTTKDKLSTISAPSNFLGKVTELHADKSLPKENIPSVPIFGSFKSVSPPTIKTSSTPLLSSVSSAAVPPVVMSATSSSSLTSSNANIDSDHVSSSPSSFLHLLNQTHKDTVSPNLPGLRTTVDSLKSEIEPAAVLKSDIHPASVLKSDIQPAAMSNSKTDLDAEAVTQLKEPLNGASELKSGLTRKSSPNNNQSSSNIKSFDLNVVSVSQAKQPSDAPQPSNSLLPSVSVSSLKNESLDVGISYEDEMEEEAPETSNTAELNLGSLGGFGISSSPNALMPKSNPFGGSFNNVATSLSSPAVTFSVPRGELFRPASFSFSSPQSSAPTQATNSGFSGGFNAVAAVSVQAPSGFGQPAQIGSGQQVLGSVLGGFGQSRQLGSGLAGGYAGSSSTSSFSNTAIGGGFAGISSTGGGFAGIASTAGGFSGGGFAGAASPGGGFVAVAAPGTGFAGVAAPGVGFSAAAAPGGFSGAGSGGGFGAFSNQGGGGGGFGAFSTVGGSKPPELFTQMRK